MLEEDRLVSTPSSYLHPEIKADACPPQFREYLQANGYDTAQMGLPDDDSVESIEIDDEKNAKVDEKSVP